MHRSYVLGKEVLRQSLFPRALIDQLLSCVPDDVQVLLSLSLLLYFIMNMIFIDAHCQRRTESLPMPGGDWAHDDV